MSSDIFSNENGTAVTVRSASDAQLPTYPAANSDQSTDATGSAPLGFVKTSLATGWRQQQVRTIPGKAQATPDRDRRMPEARDELRRLWTQAQGKLAEMMLASESGDPIELSNSASDLDHIFREMWDRRQYREIEWHSVLNFLQAVLRYAWNISGGFERLSVDECRAIADVVRHNLGPSTMDKENIRNTLKVLQAAGLDPWAAISGDPEE
jgi:hypothetical protein